MYKASQEQIEKWKAEHPAVFKITCAERKLVAYCHAPTRQQMSFVSSIKDPIKFNEALLKACWLEGDMEIQTDDSVFMGLSSQIAQLMDFEEVKLEKL